MSHRIETVQTNPTASTNPAGAQPTGPVRFTSILASRGARTAAEALPVIEYRTASLRALKPIKVDADAGIEVAPPVAGSSLRVVPNSAAESSIESRVAQGRRRAPAQLLLDGEPVVTTQRFWWSLFIRCGLNEGVFRYFEPSEVFERVSQKDAGKSIRFAIETPNRAGNPRRLLAVSPPNGPLISRNAAAEIIDNYSGTGVSYSEGKLSSLHTPAVGDKLLSIGPDSFKQRFFVDVPVDGLGEPHIHVALVRLICLNGAIGMRAAFRSTIRIGKDPHHSLDRALSHYSNDEGFSAMRQRFESSQRSWASLREVRLLETELNRISWGATAGADDRRRAFRKMVGDYESRYGLASIEALSVKRQRMLQASCRMYDLINFATEIATHHAPPAAAGRLQAWLGSAITEEYDLEGTANEVPDFVDVFTELPGGWQGHQN